MSGTPALAAGAIAAFLAVALGAFGAHALGTRLDARGRDLWRTAERYQFMHALGLILAGMAMAHGAAATTVFVLFLAGIVLFSGSLYALALGAPRRIGLLTPLGGLAFLAGWATLAAAVLLS